MTWIDFPHEEKLFEKIPQLDHGFVIWLYDFTSLMAMPSCNYELSSLVDVSFVASCSAHFIFEKLLVEFFAFLP